MPSRVHSTLYLGGTSIERSVSEAVCMAIRLAVDVMQRDPSQPCQLGLDASPELAQARAASGEDATHLLNDKAAVTFNTQMLDAVVCSSSSAE